MGNHRKQTPLRTVVAVLIPILLAAGPTEALAFGCRVGLLPNGMKFQCATCHLNPGGGGPRNPFGQAVDNIAFLCDAFWGPELAKLDSDGDGRANGAELGDPEGAWKSGDPSPGNPEAVTHPGLKDAFPPPPGSFIRGDGNCDGGLDIADAVYLLIFDFKGGPPPCCPEAGDADGDGMTSEIADAVYILTFLFLRTVPPPAPPFPSCGLLSGVTCSGNGGCGG